MNQYLFELIATDVLVSVVATSFENAKEKLRKELLLPEDKLCKIYIEKIIALLPSQMEMAKQLEPKNATN